MGAVLIPGTPNAKAEILSGNPPNVTDPRLNSDSENSLISVPKLQAEISQVFILIFLSIPISTLRAGMPSPQKVVSEELKQPFRGKGEETGNHEEWFGPRLARQWRNKLDDSPRRLSVLKPHSCLGSVFISSCISQLSGGSYLCPGEILRFSRLERPWAPGYVFPLFPFLELSAFCIERLSLGSATTRLNHE